MKKKTTLNNINDKKIQIGGICSFVEKAETFDPTIKHGNNKAI